MWEHCHRHCNLFVPRKSVKMNCRTSRAGRGKKMDNEHRSLLMLSIVCVICVNSAYSEGTDVVCPNDPMAPTITVEGAELAQQEFLLRYTVKNVAEHPIWVCDGVYIEPRGVEVDFEILMDYVDCNSLLISKRLEVPMGYVFSEPPDIKGRYIRLKPGQEQNYSTVLSTPVRWYGIFSGGGVDTVANALSLEIGYYSEDLPNLIRSILLVAEKLACGDPWDGSLEVNDLAGILSGYFRGLSVLHHFDSVLEFDKRYGDVTDLMILDYGVPLLGGERFVRHTVGNLNIPVSEEHRDGLKGAEEAQKEGL